MEPDCYQIKVLHHLNPHLIWVEVIQPQKHGEFRFEQIGIYGILPLEMEIDIVDECLKTRKGLEWAPGVATLMSQILNEAVQVWFSPTYIDRRTSIFDDNIHKYGEIAIKTKTGSLKKLSKILTKTVLAYHDDCEFHKQLVNWNLKTKLNARNTLEVLAVLEKSCTTKQIKNNWEQSIKKQTSVFQTAKHLDSALTEKNLQLHNMHLQSFNHDKVMETKMKDFHLCKEFVEDSVGRASSRKSCSRNNDQRSLYYKKIELLKKGKAAQANKINDIKPQKETSKDTLQVLEQTKKLLMKSAYKVDTDSNEKQSVPKIHSESSHTHYEANKQTNTHQTTQDQQFVLKQDTKHRQILDTEIVDREREIADRQKEIVAKKEEAEKNFVEPDHFMYRLKKKAKKSPKKLIPDFDPDKEYLVGYGPPDIDCSKLGLKAIPKDDSKYIPKEDVRIEDNIEEKKPDMLAGLDSEVNFSIQNKKENISKANECTAKVNEVSSVNSSVIESDVEHKVRSSLLAQKIRLYKSLDSSSSNSNTDTSAKDLSSSNDDNEKKAESDDEAEMAELVKKLNLNQQKITFSKTDATKVQVTEKNNVNPFKNLDASISKFVEKLVSPVLLVHSKENKRIQPLYQLQDVNFTPLIFSRLTGMSVKQPMTLQTVSWFTILRGYSLFMVSPKSSGKTLGYTPAVCRLVSDFESDGLNGTGPVCIIVCATSSSVIDVERQCRLFLNSTKTVASYFAGVDDLKITTTILNGIDVLVSTATGLVRLLNIKDFGVDLRRLSICVIDDCERLSEVYPSEIKFITMKIRQMYKSRINNAQKVQFVVASRVWCDFIETMALKAPKSVVSISSFQECVLYSKTNMTVSFVSSQNKVDHVIDFLANVDQTKRTVIVCRRDDEVKSIAEALSSHKNPVFTADSTMTVENLYALSSNWADFDVQSFGAILVCCDDNLTHLNVTNAHHLLHYSLPALYSMFAKRFAACIDYYPSIFKESDEIVKIKVLLESDNAEQLPKILHFVKRCGHSIPESLDEVCKTVLKEKDKQKAGNFVPICNATLALGDCPDYWNCNERHTVFDTIDEPKEWLPRSDVVKFKILHYHSAVTYSAKLVATGAKKFPQTYNVLSLKMGMHYSKESNRKLQGVPQVGDICAAAIKENFFERCQVVKILSRYEKNGNPNFVLVKLLDEEKWEKTRDVFLYHLPEELRVMETYVVQVRLLGVQPKDKDVSFSELALHKLKKLTDGNSELYMRGRVVTAFANTLFVNELEACQNLSSSGETVVRYNFKQELLEYHGIPNPDHVAKLQKLCSNTNIQFSNGTLTELDMKNTTKSLPKPRWAHLQDEEHLVYFATAESPGQFFVRLEKFEDCLESLTKDIQKYIETENPPAVKSVKVNDIVLAKFPDDSKYYRARVDCIPEEGKTKCFFVDHGDWRFVPFNEVTEISENFITVLPFQAIECKLIGIKPFGDSWSEFSTNWFCDQCYDIANDDLPKQLYVKYLTKEKAESTGGHKYGVALIDTTTEQDIVINKLMIEANMAQENNDEYQYLDEMDFSRKESSPELDEDLKEEEKDWNEEAEKNKRPEYIREYKDENKFTGIFSRPIRSVPLVGSDSEDSLERFDVEFSKDELLSIFKTDSNMSQPLKEILALESSQKDSQAIDVPSIKLSSVCSSNTSEFEILPSPNGMVQELDSDDLTSPDTTQTILSTPNKIDIQPLSTLRKPKVVWRQNKTNVSMRIELIGVEEYQLNIKDKHLEFFTTVHDTDYAFDFELYGVIDSTKSSHENKGLYIYVKMPKLLKKNWLSLTKDGSIKKWVVYDHDSVQVSSDEDTDIAVEKEKLKEMVQKSQNDDESDSGEDDNFIDDAMVVGKFRYDSD